MQQPVLGPVPQVAAVGQHGRGPSSAEERVGDHARAVVADVKSRGDDLCRDEEDDAVWAGLEDVPDEGEGDDAVAVVVVGGAEGGV